MAEIFISPNFKNPRAPHTLLQLKEAIRLCEQGGIAASGGTFPRTRWAINVVSDWGPDGSRLGAQAVNYAWRGNVHAIDLTHDIKPFDIRHAAFVLESNLRLAVPNTIFLCVVDPEVGSERTPIVVQGGNKTFFIGPHNGVFDLVLRGINTIYGLVKAVEISRNTQHVIREGAIHAVDGDAIFAPAAGAIVRHYGIPDGLGAEIPLSQFGEVRNWEEARLENGKAHGSIEWVDHYGTFVTNIPPGLLELDDRPGTLIAIRGEKSNFSITAPYATHFAAVEAGKPLVLLQGNGFLHIAINHGRAVEHLGFEKFGEGIELEVLQAKVEETAKIGWATGAWR